MSKTVLLIESDAPFARDLSSALEAKGFGVRTSSDGKEGVELARALRPDCVVLCVELPGLSGYSWCNRLKKDESLRSIPLVITSSEATPETFEQHRKLKTRAEDYLIKPFPPATLVERVGALVGMPEAPSADDELLPLADVELDETSVAAEEDADLRKLDEAFDSIASGLGSDEPSTRPPGSPVAEPPLTLLPDADEAPAVLDLDREMADALASIEGHVRPAPRVAPPSPPPAPVRLVEPTVEPTPAEEEPTPVLLEDVEVLPAFDVTDASLAASLQATQEEARALRQDLDDLRAEKERWEGKARAGEADFASAKARLESSEASVVSLSSGLEAARGDALQARDRVADLEREVALLRPRLEEAERAASVRGNEAAQASDRAGGLERTLEEERAAAAALHAEIASAREDADRLRAQAASAREDADRFRAQADAMRVEIQGLRDDGDALRQEIDTLRAELEGARSVAATLRAEGETRAGELARRLEEAQAQAAGHEDRLLRAYQKIKGDEKVREKTRKALALILQVLEERSPGDGAPPPAAPER